MPFAGAWCKIWIYFGFVFAWTKGARPRFDTSTDMGLVLVPSDAEVDSVIFRLRATDQDADFPLVFEITATITPVVRIDNLPCTLYNKVCQANVILTKRLAAGRLHDFAVRVRDTKGDSNSMQATISVTNATTPRDKIFPHIPSLIMVPEDTKPGKELDYLLVRANSWSGKPVYIELWQPKELFTIRQRQTPTQTRGIITLIGELDFETQSVYTLTMYATDPYTEPGKDTRNIAGLNVAVVVTDVQDVPPIFTLAPPLTRINNSVQPGDTVLRVHAEDGDKGVPREIVYGLVSEGNPFTLFFNISESSGEIILARPLEELTQITHVGAPIVLTVVAEEIRRSREEPPAQATVVDVGFLLGEPGNSPPYFESDNYVARIDENPEPGTVINFGEQYPTKVKDEDIGKAGVFALKLENNNGTFEIIPTVAERTADFVIVVRDNTLIDYELYKSLSFKIIAQEVGPATNLSASVPVTIFLNDVNDNPPIFDEESYEVTLSENVTAGSRVVQVHAADVDTGSYGEIRYTGVTGEGNEAFSIEHGTGLITVAMGSSLDRETAARLLLSVEARDEGGNGNRGMAPLIVNLLDVNDNAPTFEKGVYEFILNAELTNFTSPAFIKAADADAEPPNNVVRYELIHGNYENKFYLNETSGELTLRSPITRIRRKKQSTYDKFAEKAGKEFVRGPGRIQGGVLRIEQGGLMDSRNESDSVDAKKEAMKRRKRDGNDALYTLTARAYDLGIPHLSSETQIRIVSGIAMEARIMMFVVPGEQPNSKKTAETLATITGGKVTVLETRPYVQQNHTGSTSNVSAGGKKSIIVARVEQTEPGTPLVDVEKIRETLAANGVGIIGGNETLVATNVSETKAPVNGTPRTNDGQTTIINNTIYSVQSEEVTVYKAENKLLFWLLIILGLLMLVAIAILIICCICPGCPFYMEPRKRRVHSSETLLGRADGRPKRHLHRQPAGDVSWNGRKQAWSADPTRRNWQFNKRNVKNCSLPGDVAFISGQPIEVQMNVEAPRLRDTSYDHSRRSRVDEQERMYMEEVERQKTRGYDAAELDSLQRHEMDRGSDVQRQGYRQRYMEHDANEEAAIREQHFYREGNAEVLRLVTRGQLEDAATSHHHRHHHPTTLIVDGKDIILQRFIEDQKSRHELSMQDIEAARVLESHQRSKETCQQQPAEIILLPDRLDLGPRQHVEEIGPNVQRLVIDHGDYGSQKVESESQVRETLRQERQVDGVAVIASERPSMITKDQLEVNKAQYFIGDLELARQKTLLARLLLKREHRHAEGGIADSTSYLETQSLPGQVAIATQTDRTTATQTDRQVRSRSDNDESDEDSRHRKKLKSRKKYGDGDWKRTRTLWMKSPIEEEGTPRFDKRLSILRKKVREVKEDRKISLEPEVLREISDSLDGNGSSCKGEEDESMQTYRKSTEQTSISYKVLNEKENDSPSSMETRRNKPDKAFSERSCEETSDCRKMNGTESSSPEIKAKREKHGREKLEEKSPKKEAKQKAQKKSDGVIKPSFRILEKEFTMLTKKLSKLGDKKFQGSTGSDSTSQEKLEPKESKKELDQKASKKLEASSSQRQTESGPSASKTEQKGKQKKETAIAKAKQKLKYQQTHVMSTGSSEYDDGLDKMKKQSGVRQESVKQKQPVSVQSHSKGKRQTQTDRREAKRQMAELREEEFERQRDGAAKESLRAESKPEKHVRGVTRASKLAVASRRDNVTEDTNTSTNSDREGRKDAFAPPVSEKKSSTDSSGKDFNGVYRREKQPVGGKVVQRFSDDFVEGSRIGSTEGEASGVDKEKRSVEKEQIGREKKTGIDCKVQSKENGLHNNKSSAKKSTETEGQVDAEKVGEDSAMLRDVAQKLIESCVTTDPPQVEEEKMIGAVAENQKIEGRIATSKTASTAMEKPVLEYTAEEQLGDIGSAVKLSGKNGATVEKRKEVTMNGSEKDNGKDKLLDDTKRQMHEFQNFAKEFEQEFEVLDKIREHVGEEIEKLPKDEEREGLSLGEHEKEMKHEMPSMIPKRKETDMLSSDGKTGVEVKDDIESENEMKKIEEREARVEGAAEGGSNGKADLIQGVAQSVEENVDTQLLSDEIDRKEQDMKSDLKDDEEELFGAHKQMEESVESSQSISADRGKEDTTEIITDDRETGSASLNTMKSAFKEEETVAKTDDQGKQDISLEGEEKVDDEEEKGAIKIVVHDEGNGEKIEEERKRTSTEETVFPDDKELPHEEKKTSIELMIDDNEIKERENGSSKEGSLQEGKEAGTFKIDKEENVLPDKAEKVVIDTTIGDEQIGEKETIVPDTERSLDRKEEAITKEATIDDHEVSVELQEGNISLDKEKEIYPAEGKVVIQKIEIPDEKEEQCSDKEVEVTPEMQTIVSSTDDHLITGKDNAIPEASKPEDHPISENEDDFKKTQHDHTFEQEITPEVPDVSDNGVSQGEDGSPKAVIIPEQTVQEDSASTNVPISVGTDIKKVTPPMEHTIDGEGGKKIGFLSDMLKTVHTWTDKLKGGKRSVSTSSESELEATELSPHSDDKIIKEDVVSLSTNDNDKFQTEGSKSSEPSHSEAEDQSLKTVEKVRNIEETGREVKDKGSITPADEKLIISPKEMTENESTIGVAAGGKEAETRINDTEKKDEGSAITPADEKITISPKELTEIDSRMDVVAGTKEEEGSVNEVETETEEERDITRTQEKVTIMPTELIEKDSEAGTAIKEEDYEGSKEGSLKVKVSDEARDFDIPLADKVEPGKMEEQRDALHDKGEESMQKVVEESARLAELSDNKTTDGKLLQAREKEDESREPPSEGGYTSRGTDFLETSPVTSETMTKEKFAFDSIAPEAPTDSPKIAEPAEHFKSGSEQIELQKAEQSVGRESCTMEADKVQPFLEDQPLKGQDASMISQGESSKRDAIDERVEETLTLEDSVVVKDEKEETIGQQYTDVSLPLFTSVIRTVDDSDESDSSSDISRKTALNTTPYQTPRHRARQSPEKGSAETMGNIETLDVEGEEEASLTIELTEDEKDEKIIEAAEDTSKEQPSEAVPTKTLKDEDTEVKEEGGTSSKHKDVTPPGISADKGQGRKQLIPKLSLKPDDKPASNTKDDSSSAPKRAETVPPKAGDGKAKQTEKKRVPAQKKKKSTSEESSGEKATHYRDQASHSRYRPRRKLVDGQSKQKDGDQAKQWRKTDDEQRRRQSTSKVKAEKDRRASSSSDKQTISPKSGDIDTSKTQPKYMAWYKKNREEMEKRRAELRATDDEDQLPRWLRRSMRSQKSDKGEGRKSEERNLDTTPRGKRKVKPLVNVESEQLKAIVRQGRKLRKAEGGKNEDPPVQIFATTPPAQPPADSKHHLVQHSEYKYEKVPAPFYLHPPPAPHPSPQMSPERFDGQATAEHRHADKDFDPGVPISLQSGNRLRHQQLLEKKSVFDIAYSEAAPPQLRADSTTPPS